MDPAISQALYFAKKDADKMIHQGPIPSMVAGRTDHVPMHVASGSYVIPADIVAALGQNNTMAGFRVLDAMFKSGPYGTPLKQRATGGQVMAPEPVPIMAAGGEYVVSPDLVATIGRGSMDQGHAVLDSFVKNVRKDHVKELSRLPGPAKD